MSDQARIEAVEQQLLLRIETEDTSENPPTMRREVENIIGARRRGQIIFSGILCNCFIVMKSLT